jgi:hypothetical protein
MHYRTTSLDPGKLRGNATTVYLDLRAAVNKIQETKAQHTTSQQVGTSTLQFVNDARVYAHQPRNRPFEFLKYNEKDGEGKTWSHYWWIEVVECADMERELPQGKARDGARSEQAGRKAHKVYEEKRGHGQDSTMLEELKREDDFLKSLGL